MYLEFNRNKFELTIFQTLVFQENVVRYILSQKRPALQISVWKYCKLAEIKGSHKSSSLKHGTIKSDKKSNSAQIKST